jgi:hypothetical protein
MAKITLDGREFDIAPYKLGSLRKAAPIIDRINATMAKLDSMEGMAQSASDLAAVLSIGLVKIDPALTPEGLDDLVGFDDLPAMLACFTEIMEQSGLTQGEATAPAPETAPAGASSKASEQSSTN